jgi:predicted kinase
MKLVLILVAGYPGTGKTYLANMLVERFSQLSLLSPDDIKEQYWDRYGFDNAQEKEELIQRSWEEYFRRMEEAFRTGKSLVSDYPFSDKQKSRIASICGKYSCQIFTIRLTGDIDILFERQKHRDMDNSRHPGHVFSVYHKGSVEYRNDVADGLLDYQEFKKRCTTRGYETFSLGKTWEIDVSDFKKVDYTELLRELEIYLA